jgi:hypothetical protein
LIGHKATECRRTKNNKEGFDDDKSTTSGKSGAFTGTSNYCDIVGHKYADCRFRIKDEKNGVHKKKRSDQANVSQDSKGKSSSRTEVSLMAFEMNAPRKDKRKSKDPQGNYYACLSATNDDEEIEDRKINAEERKPKNEDVQIVNFEDCFEPQVPNRLNTSTDNPNRNILTARGKIRSLDGEARELKNAAEQMPFASLAYKNYIRVNGTQKQRDKLELKDFEKFIETFVQFSFYLNNSFIYIKAICFKISKILGLKR